MSTLLWSAPLGRGLHMVRIALASFVFAALCLSACVVALNPLALMSALVLVVALFALCLSPLCFLRACMCLSSCCAVRACHVFVAVLL